MEWIWKQGEVGSEGIMVEVEGKLNVGTIENK